MKLSELEFIRSVREEYPVLLLDDVLSELDEHRREKLLGFINGTVQTFLTVNTAPGPVGRWWLFTGYERADWRRKDERFRTPGLEGVLGGLLARQQFLLHWLESHGDLGHTAADHSQPYRLENGTLYVHTDNPMWSNQLHMMQGKLLGQLNRQLVPALKGRKRILRELKFYHGIIQEENPA